MTSLKLDEWMWSIGSHNDQDDFLSLGEWHSKWLPTLPKCTYGKILCGFGQILIRYDFDKCSNWLKISCWYEQWILKLSKNVIYVSRAVVFMYLKSTLKVWIYGFMFERMSSSVVSNFVILALLLSQIDQTDALFNCGAIRLRGLLFIIYKFKNSGTYLQFFLNF